MVVMTVREHHMGERGEIDPHHGGVVAQRPATAAVKQHPEAVTLQQQCQPSLGQTAWQMNVVIHQHGKLQHLAPLKTKRRHEACVFIDTPVTGSW